MKQKDIFPADAWKQELDQLHMPKETAVRALSRMKGEERMLKRTLHTAFAALMVLIVTIGAGLALTNREHEKQSVPMAQPDKMTCIIPEEGNCAPYVFTLEKALYEGDRLLILYRLEGEGKYIADQMTDEIRNDLRPAAELVQYPMFDMTEYHEMRGQFWPLQAKESVTKYARGFTGHELYTADGLSMGMWGRMETASVNDLHCIYMELSEQADTDWQPFRKAAEENVWLNQKEITLQLPIALWANTYARDGETELYCEQSNMEQEKMISITVARTDELETGMIQEQVYRADDNTFIILPTEQAPLELMEIYNAEYDGDSITLQYGMAGNVKLHEDVPKESLDSFGDPPSDEDLYYMSGKLSNHYAHYKMLRMRDDLTGTSGTVYENVLVPLQNDAGEDMSLWVLQYNMGYGSVITEHYMLLSSPRNEPSKRDGDALQQPWILQDEITVWIVLPEATYTAVRDENGVYRLGGNHSTGEAGVIRIPVRISCQQKPLGQHALTTDNTADYVHTMISVMDYAKTIIYTRENETNSQWRIMLNGPKDRVFNQKTDIPMTIWREKDDMWSHFYQAPYCLNRELGVHSVTERYVRIGEPEVFTGEPIADLLDIKRGQAGYNIVNGKMAKAPDIYIEVGWKEDADLSVFEGMEEVTVRFPVLEVIAYAEYYGKYAILYGEQVIPLENEYVFITMSVEH